ncbi:hypothetical protein H2198_008831 [Neophaeococcomyces mojaviensis]|uniref:Uncharacterized protein n=1 Tax=Neophaeococcomyces mojaviensis TaxID=3383035 RepID=A0ACC2ZWH2_9EURO|nr:hypothetical protein H2198_008831 [Knufia sp. JES_112]
MSYHAKQSITPARKMLAFVFLFVAPVFPFALPPHDVNLQDLTIARSNRAQRVPLQPSISPLSTDFDDSPLPVIVWHGLGDASNADGLADTGDIINEVHPGTYVHFISANGESDDRSASFFGNVTEQIDLVCETLAKDPILSTALAVDAIGFSQGGQFLRGYVERCGSWAPKVRSLVTFGSQHNGIVEFQKCKGATDFVCHAANALLKSSTVWSDYVQSHLVPAQYYRDLNDYENYLAHSNFLADINNERNHKNETYKENLAQLEKFVMILFEDDNTVIPKESGWFAEVNATSGHVTLLKNRPIYQENWIGLKDLDEKGGLVFETVRGEHMQLKEKDLKRIFRKYLGPLRKDARDGLKVDL